ncbi:MULTISPECIES: helix-turn-helix domain-containing protein [Subtercola]|uniref:Helix-turn-helix domain-containing protein n=1 Tax=Subtercola vilae TaxID=2056433 RepID=A0A4T2CAJ7_9MICO|nr:MULTISPECIES: helix-turn-helix domain-containing protein [Subtercola]MEA9985363.1 helix-turn-helix domain-containing protein [Subtercola sp. RTI3]TIH40889.1 helix-turn-helix domain-containing protein [Subtercola vilae]
MSDTHRAIVPEIPWRVRSRVSVSAATGMFANHAELSARDASTFSAALIVSSLGSVDLAVLDASRHRGARTAKLMATDDRDCVSLIFVRSGAVTVYQDGRVLRAPTGTLFALRSRATYHYSAGGRVSLVSVTSPSLALPLGLVRTLKNVTATALPDSVLTRSALAFVEAIAASINTPNGVEAKQLEQQLLLLISGLLVENFGSRQRGPTSDSSVLAAAASSIAAHSSTRGYGPRDVADDTGVDLRRLYRIFGAENVSIAELIRDTRLELIAAALTDPSNRNRFADISVRAGFTGADQAARAFRRKYGVSMSSYRSSTRP